MQHQEKYTLHWPSYSDHLREALKDMMTSREFADVTLVTDDKQQIRAHRNILSAASPVFKNILQHNSNNTNPVINLSGIQHSEMESIMQLIYLGEARFYEERMSEFLMVSKKLDIKDLSRSIEMNDQQTASNEDNTEYEDNVAHKAEDTFQTFNEDGANVDSQIYTSTTGINAANRKVKREDGTKYDCNQCGKQFSDRSPLSRHIKSKHECVKYACNQCDYQATRKDSLKTHIQSIHECVKYACNQCDQQYSDQTGLRKHIQSVHDGYKYPCDQCDYRGTLHIQKTYSI